MAKLIDDPAVQAVVSKQVTAATKSTTRAALIHLKNVFDELKAEASTAEKRLLKAFHDNVKDRVKTTNGEV